MYLSSADNLELAFFSPTLFLKVAFNVSSYLQLLCYETCSSFATEVWYLILKIDV